MGASGTQENERVETMQVAIKTYTNDPMRAVSLAAGVCYGKRNYSEKRVRTCFNLGHMSVFEQASIQFLIEGISRSCSHQIVRHRLNSYCQESQRYCRYDLSGDDWFVTPHEYQNDPDLRKWFRNGMRRAARGYTIAVDGGSNAEDARFVLPEACKTSIMMTMNVRNLFHFLDMRLDSHAQWEIREVARAMFDACMENDDLRPFIELYKSKRGDLDE